MGAAGLIVAATDQAVAEDAVEVSAAHVAAAGAVAEAAATVTVASISVAEARILPYLRTQLSVAVMADKLGISWSAAKDRAERSCKKLGVHSRAEAVRWARALGSSTERGFSCGPGAPGAAIRDRCPGRRSLELADRFLPGQPRPLRVQERLEERSAPGRSYRDAILHRRFVRRWSSHRSHEHDQSDQGRPARRLRETPGFLFPSVRVSSEQLA